MQRTTLLVTIVGGVMVLVNAIAPAACVTGCACMSCFGMWDNSVGSHKNYRMAPSYSPLCRDNFYFSGTAGYRAVSCSEPVFIERAAATNQCYGGTSMFIGGSNCGIALDNPIQVTTCACIND